MEKSKISFVQTISSTKNTVFSKISTGGEDQNFMLAIKLTSTMRMSVVDLSSSQRYFDFQIDSMTLKDSIIAGFETYPLEPCTKDHWNAFPSISAEFDDQ